MTTLKRFFSDGYRVFFLAAALFAMLSIAVWEGWLAIQAMGGMADLPVRPAPHLWHAHEMIFGFGAAAVGGFFLTAVPNWTGAKAAPHVFVAVVAGLWLLGRLALWYSGVLPPTIVAVADLAFVPVLMLKVLMQLLHKPKPQQMIFMVILTLYWAANLMVHMEWVDLLQDGVWAGLRMGLVTLCAMIMVLGGRVTPGFTRNAMVRAGREHDLPRNPAPLAAFAIAAALIQPAGYLLGLPDGIMGATAIAAGLAGLARVALWRGLWTWRQPILWVMHIGYALNAAGFLFLGLSDIGIGNEMAALHILGIGGVGTMTYAVMSRAILGHSGRALIAPRGVAVGYALIPLAVLARVIGSVLPGLYYPAVLTAGALWIIAFALFTACMWEPIWGARASRTEKAPQ
ncbi:NnrS family protein [Pseudorhodobacter aquimaris]|uniref:NnrS family protein n=1 Tax=Pseudorhodobacter aquimaris TaxID=687412 RepID=UPI00067D7FD8|nr:NnrS family protein [Pseudorhodobacter aquimaris]